MSPRLRWSERGCPVSRFDSYARAEAARRRAYRSAYSSAEALTWMAGLKDDAKARAEALGLLKPLLDSTSRDGSLEPLSAATEPCQDDSYDDGLVARPLRDRERAASVHPAWRKLLGDVETHRAELMRAFLESSDNPKRCWACLCFLLGQGTCAHYAKNLGMSKQAFHYHVRKLEKMLGLPPMGNQRSEAARRSYCLTNRRRHK